VRSPPDHHEPPLALDQDAPAADLVRAATAALEEIARGARELRAIRHPLGFLCFPVHRDDGHGVCVHVFDGGAATELTTSPVHSHSWELTSCVLYGEVVNRRMVVREERREPTHRLYEVDSDPAGVDELRPTARLVSCEPGRAQTSRRGEIYTLAAGEFHTTVVPRGTAAATLVLGRSLPGRQDVSLGPLHGAGHRVVRRTCDAALSVATARAVLGRMHGPGAR
jgi:hypothetical protein